MTIQLSDKINELHKWVLHAFEDACIEDILNNARKSGEAICKAIILKHYGEVKGSKIIFGQERPNGIELRGQRPPDFSGLIDIISHGQDDDLIIIKHKSTRNKIKHYLEALRSHGNPASHDTNTLSDLCKPSEANYTKFALAQLIDWFHNDYMAQSIPQKILQYMGDIESSYINPEKETPTSYKELRGFDIVEILYPKQRVKQQSKPKDSQKKISYEFITVEITDNVLIGFLFLEKNNLSIAATLHHFIENLSIELVSLTICSERVISEKGKEVNRIGSIQSRFNDLANENLLVKTKYFYTDYFVWKYCLAQHARVLKLDLEYEKHFVDQELFNLQDDKLEELQPSLQYVKTIFKYTETHKPVNIIVGRAGVGKTTFCEQVVSLVNGYDQKRALLISSTDLRNAANTDVSVKSLTDLYSLFVKVNQI
jgi:hypothetical protein